MIRTTRVDERKGIDMSNAEGRGRRLSARLSDLAGVFWQKPALVSLHAIAVIFASLAVIGVLLASAGIDSRFSVSPMYALFLVFLAWALSSRKVSQIIVGTFLVVTFMLSIFLLILPVEALVGRISKIMTDEIAREGRLWSVSTKISMANGTLTNLESYYPELAKDASYASAKKDLSDVLELLPKSEPSIDNRLIQQMTETVSGLLKTAAPFIFTMLMGLMGSAIAVSRQFVTNFEEKPAIWYLYRLLQGMIIALLIVYGLIAGMLSLGVSSGNEPIDISKFDTNKYFIGFVSALAGLFSEHAFAKLESVSSNFFGKTAGKGAAAGGGGTGGATALTSSSPSSSSSTDPEDTARA